jgi:phosphoglycolate phosphatase-like HAD superfamily hydrolase
MAQLRFIVLDFDGTCTQVDRIWQGFLAAYVTELRAANAGAPSDEAWAQALATVAAASPAAGWTLDNAPSTAPAAADPYIQAGEAAALLRRRDPALVLPPTAFARAYAACPAPWRDEALEVVSALVDRGLHVGFVSNSDTAKVAGRVDELLAGRPALRAAIHVHGNAKKYLVRELPFSPSAPHADRFEAIPAVAATVPIGRPVYLRRGAYFEALCALWRDRGELGFPIDETLVCGDVWELDLALPQVLGAQVHLIRRAPPYLTCVYERAQVNQAHQSDDLRGLLARV